MSPRDEDRGADEQSPEPTSVRRTLAAQSAERAECERLRARVAELEWAARGGNAINDNAMALEHAADELTRLGSKKEDFIRALRERAVMIRATLALPPQEPQP